MFRLFFFFFFNDTATTEIYTLSLHDALPIYHRSAALTEYALQACGGLAMAIGLERIRGRTQSIVHDIAAQLIAGLSLAVIVIGLALDENPFLVNQEVDGYIFNIILLGYALP